eukprot:gene7795-5608_t
MNYEGDVGSGKLSRTSGMAENSILGSTETVYVGSSKTARKQLEKVQKTIADRSEKNILRYLPTINETCANLHLPGTVKDTAVKLFVDVMSKKLLIVNKPAIAATCIYLSCRIMQCPRVLEEIALGTGTDVSLIQRMQSDILKGMSMVVRITKSGDIFLRFAQRCLERLHLRQCEDIRTSATPLTHQLVLSLPYLCLEEGISLCERIAEYELLPENIAPQAVVGAVLVWLFLLIADIEVKSIASSTRPPETSTPVKVLEPTLDGNDDSTLSTNDDRPVLTIKADPGMATTETATTATAATATATATSNVSHVSWPPITLDIIAEECFTTVTVLKNVMLRLFASMKVLVILPASGADSASQGPAGVTSGSNGSSSVHSTTSSVRHSPPVEVHQRFAQAFERLQDALAVAAATAVTSVSSPTSTTATGKKRKRSLSIGGGMPMSAPSSSVGAALGSTNGGELALTLDRLLTGEAERPYIRSPLWQVDIATDKDKRQDATNVDGAVTDATTALAAVPSFASPPNMLKPPSMSSVATEGGINGHRLTPHSAPVSRVTSAHQLLPRVASTSGLKLTPSLTPRSNAPKSARDEEIQRLSRGLFTSGLKRFKAL